MNEPPVKTLRSFSDDCLPPERTFESKEDLFEFINAWAAPRGYAFTTKKSTRSRSGRQTVTYGCDRCFRPSSESKPRQRKTSSRGTGCPFSILANELDRKIWVITHRPNKRFALHNHEPSSAPSSHPAHRKLSSEQTSTLIGLANSGTSVKNIITHMHKSYGTISTEQDIYNILAKNRRDRCEGQNSTQALANGNPQLLLEPHCQIDRIVSSSTRPKLSTMREPSAFEAVEAAARSRTLPTCSKCHTLGHIMTSRICPLRYSEPLSTSATSEEQIMIHNKLLQEI